MLLLLNLVPDARPSGSSSFDSVKFNSFLQEEDESLFKSLMQKRGKGKKESFAQLRDRFYRTMSTTEAAACSVVKSFGEKTFSSVMFLKAKIKRVTPNCRQAASGASA